MYSIAFQRKPLEMGFSQLRLMGLGQLIKLHDDLLPQAWIETINKFRELGRLIRWLIDQNSFQN